MERKMHFERHRELSHYLKKLRLFFDEQDFTEVFAPPLVTAPNMEALIPAFSVTSAVPCRETLYLSTSPEFYLKKCLSEGASKIYSLNYSFRDEPSSEIHRPEFIMLEWYRKNAQLTDIISDCNHLLQQLSGDNFITPEIKTLDSFFQNFFCISLENLAETDVFKKYLMKYFPAQSFASYDWIDCFTFAMSECIEPQFQAYDNLFVIQFPAKMAALSQKNPNHPFWCDRFEWYVKGVEIANCYQELTDIIELENRFRQQQLYKQQIFQQDMPYPYAFFNNMEHFPKSAGIALGVERLLQVLFKKDFFICPKDSLKDEF